jgi:hypothetical protein
MVEICSVLFYVPGFHDIVSRDSVPASYKDLDRGVICLVRVSMRMGSLSIPISETAQVASASLDSPSLAREDAKPHLWSARMPNPISGPRGCQAPSLAREDAKPHLWPARMRSPILESRLQKTAPIPAPIAILGESESDILPKPAPIPEPPHKTD